MIRTAPEEGFHPLGVVRCRRVPELYQSTLPPTEQLPDGGRQGENDFGKLGYGGPCPPSGRHRYRFTLYALDAELGVPASSTRKEIEKAMQGHVLETAQLTGVYTRGR